MKKECYDSIEYIKKALGIENDNIAVEEDDGTEDGNSES